MKTRIVAFYLPQFHPIEENDKFWGKGFTEWSFVAKARPLFRHHYQPRLPEELGFYDLRMLDVLKQQVELAKNYGIDAFCFYFYWFDGKKILYKPIENFVKSNINFNYCLLWANENWTRRWDGEEHYVLIKQSYNLDDMKNLIKEFIVHFKDERYLRINGKPLLIIYRINDIPIWEHFAYSLREEVYRAISEDIHISAVWGIKGINFPDPPSQYGLDSYLIFPPHGCFSVDSKNKVVDLNKNFIGTIYDYDALLENDLKKFMFGYEHPFQRGLMLGWDNTARVNYSSRIFIGYTPLRFFYWLKGVFKEELFLNCNEENIVFINAWNEWAEGTYLEPDERYGRTTLKLVKLCKDYIRQLKDRVYHQLEDLKYNLQHNDFGYLEKLRIPPSYKVVDGDSKFDPQRINLLLIAHAASSSLFGGERSFLDLLKIYSSIEKFNIYVAVNSFSNEAYINEIKKYAINIFQVDFKQWLGGCSAEPGIFLQFVDIITRYNIHIVYANTIVLLEPSLAAKKLNRTSVTHVREIISEDPYLSFQIGYKPEEIKRKIYDRSDVLICNSNATQQSFMEFDFKYLLPNLVDINGSISVVNEDISLLIEEINEEKRKGKIIFGMISSNIPKKGLLNLLELVRHLKAYSDKICFLVVGPKNRFVKYIEETLKSEEINFVKFLGYVENALPLIYHMDVILNLSDFSESFGRTVAEGLALGKPILAFNRGAIKELVEHGETGFLVEYKDFIELRDYCVRFINESGLIEKMGEKAKISVLKYNFENIRERANIIMDDIINRFKLEATKKDIVRVSIIIPVYNAPNELYNCLKSLIKHTKLDELTELIIMNDCSLHSRVYDILSEFEKLPYVRVFHNKKNLGYTKTINRAIEIAEDRDVVLLNSDTILTPFWLEGLVGIAYSEKEIGTVTAMSDNAGAFSFPVPNKPNPKPPNISFEEYALRIIHNCIECKPPEVPTGNGFCLYIKREVINQIGLFDEEAFPFGYGEENDFCMRAMYNGWKNVISPWSFVYHVRSASFGDRRNDLVSKAMRIINKRYPNYKELVEKMFNSEEINILRNKVNTVFKFYQLYSEVMENG